MIGLLDCHRCVTDTQRYYIYTFIYYIQVKYRIYAINIATVFPVLK